jgi:hypothetical protein
MKTSDALVSQRLLKLLDVATFPEVNVCLKMIIREFVLAAAPYQMPFRMRRHEPHKRKGHRRFSP